MRDFIVAEGIVPLGEFKAQAPRYLDDVAGTGRPIVITRNGRPAAVLLSPAEFDRLRERLRLLESVAAGLDDAEAGRVMDTETLRYRLRESRGDVE